MLDDKRLAGVMSEVSLKNLECADGDANDGIHPAFETRKDITTSPKQGTNGSTKKGLLSFKI